MLAVWFYVGSFVFMIRCLAAFGLLISSIPFQGGARLPRGGGSLSFLAKKKVTKESCQGSDYDKNRAVAALSLGNMCAVFCQATT